MSRYAPLKERPESPDEGNVMEFQAGKPNPMSNAERQARWRKTHRYHKPGNAFTGPPPTPKVPLPPPQATPPELLGPEALFENYIRKMQPARKLYLAMLIMDDLNALAGKRKSRRNQQYVVAAMECANALAQLPQNPPAEEYNALPAPEYQINQPLLVE